MNKPQINVTPLIDVLLVLLIIFMVVSPMKPSAFSARIPRPPDTKSDVLTNPDTLVVVISRDSSIALNKEPLVASVEDSSALTERLKTIFKLREDAMTFIDNHDGSVPQVERTVFIKAPKSLSYGIVARVVDAVKMAGANPVSLQIDDLE